jgi:hypothetical protein
MDSDVKFVLKVLAVMVAPFAVASCVFGAYRYGVDSGQRAERQELVKCKLGRYEFDETTGEARFDYIRHPDVVYVPRGWRVGEGESK